MREAAAVGQAVDEDDDDDDDAAAASAIVFEDDRMVDKDTGCPSSDVGAIAEALLAVGSMEGVWVESDWVSGRLGRFAAEADVGVRRGEKYTDF